jgi:hypothetical protein
MNMYEPPVDVNDIHDILGCSLECETVEVGDMLDVDCVVSEDVEVNDGCDVAFGKESLENDHRVFWQESLIRQC